MERTPVFCDRSYWICDVTAGCQLDDEHYVSGAFPGTRRLLVETAPERSVIQMQLFLSELLSPGTELVVQLRAPDCSLNAELGRVHLVGADLAAEAGSDQTLTLTLHAGEPGEHLVEIYSDAIADYLLVVDPS